MSRKRAAVANQGGGLEISAETARLGAFIEKTAGFWIKAAGVESAYLKHDLAQIPIRAPIYVTGLARAGSTILLELLAEHPDVGSHRYRDFPPVYTPVMWDWLLKRMPTQAAEPTERSHKDRIFITPDSPEAMEEAIWMRFFPDLHDPARDNSLDGATRAPAFEKFYRDHVAKILLIRDARRYVSKGNYAISRLAYLKRLFDDALFVVPVRDPVHHIASLIKQHRLFQAAEGADGRILDHMRRAGHFEFGLDLRPINFGHAGATARVRALWAEGEEVRGWAAYWADVYGHVLARLAADDGLRQAVKIVRFHELCRKSERVLADLFDHCGLAVTDQDLARWAARLTAPSYYRPAFSERDLDVIAEETGAIAEAFGVKEAGA